MMYKYWFVIWGVCSSCLTVLSRYIDLLFGELFFTFITCNDVSWLPYACFGCVITFRNFNFVRVLSQTRATTALSEKKRRKKEGKALLYFTQESKPLHHFLYRQGSFCKGKHEQNLWSPQKLKFGCSKIASLATDTEKQTKPQTNKKQKQKKYEESSFCKAKKQKQQTNRKLLTRSTFCNINTQGGSKDVIQARQQGPESPAVTHLTRV